MLFGNRHVLRNVLNDAIFVGSVSLKTPCLRSDASLVFVTCRDHLFLTDRAVVPRARFGLISLWTTSSPRSCDFLPILSHGNCRFASFIPSFRSPQRRLCVGAHGSTTDQRPEECGVPRKIHHLVRLNQNVRAKARVSNGLAMHPPGRWSFPLHGPCGNRPCDRCWGRVRLPC